MPTPEEVYKRSLDATVSNNTANVQWNKPATFLKAIPEQKQTWDDIWLKFMESEEYAACSQEELFSTYSKWLEANYKAPVRK